MWFAIFGKDKDDSLALRKELRPAHLARLQTMLEQKRVLIAGPHPKSDGDDPMSSGFTGSLMVIDFESQADAESWISEDPYVLGGVFESVEVKPFVKVVP